MLTIGRAALIAVAVAVASVASCKVSRGADLETAIIVLCDKAEQVADVVKHSDSKSTVEAIDAVNTAANDPQACIVVAATYIQGKEVSRIANRHGAFGIFAVMVIAVRHPSGMFMPLQIPFEGYSPHRVGEGERKT